MVTSESLGWGVPVMDWERETGKGKVEGGWQTCVLSGKTLYCVLTLVSFFLKENSRGNLENLFVHVQQCL